MFRTILRWIGRKIFYTGLINGTRIAQYIDSIAPNSFFADTVKAVAKQGWQIYMYDLHRGLYLFKKDDIKLIQPHAGVLNEDLNKYKVFDYKGKTVLDVGAYFGETSVLFHKWGAKKIIAVEPIKEHVEILKENIKLNNVPAEILPRAVGDKNGKGFLAVDGTMIGHPELGLKKGKTHIAVEFITWEKLLKIAIEKGVTIAKVDCEGAERFLADVPAKLLRKIPNWIIEAHSEEIEQKLTKKFSSCGFSCVLNFKQYALPCVFFLLCRQQRAELCQHTSCASED